MRFSAAKWSKRDRSSVVLLNNYLAVEYSPRVVKYFNGNIFEALVLLIIIFCLGYRVVRANETPLWWIVNCMVAMILKRSYCAIILMITTFIVNVVFICSQQYMICIGNYARFVVWTRNVWFLSGSEVTTLNISSFVIFCILLRILHFYEVYNEDGK